MTKFGSFYQIMHFLLDSGLINKEILFIINIFYLGIKYAYVLLPETSKLNYILFYEY